MIPLGLRLSLATKIFLGFLALIALSVLLALVNIQESRALATELRALRDGYVKLARLAELIDTHTQKRSRDLKDSLDEPDPDQRHRIYLFSNQYFPNAIDGAVTEMRQVCATQKPLAEGPSRHFYLRVMERLDRIERLHDELGKVTEQLQSAGSIEARKEIKPLLWSVGSNLEEQTFGLNRLINAELDKAVKQAEDGENTAVFRVLAMTTVALIIGLLLTALGARALSPISKLVAYARAISRGDYEQQVSIRGENELSNLADELKQMARSRKDREQELDRQADQLEAAYKRVEELKRYHERVIRSLRTGIVVTDRTLNVTSTNPAAETHWGLSDALGHALAELQLGNQLSERTALKELIERAEAVTLQAVPLDEKLADVTLAPLVNERDMVLGLVVALEDVTEAVRTKEALIRSERLATIGRMSAHVTHEIRNPLSAIGLNTELLEDLLKNERSGADKEEAKSICQAIGREVDRLTSITEEYLRFARLPRPVLRTQNIAQVLESIAGFVRRDCEAAGASIEVEGPSDLTAQLDHDQIRQTLLNLVRNAKESMPEGGKISLIAETRDDQLALMVRDEGVGIPKEVVDRIFDPFYSTKLTGTGLGLALCQQIVRGHGGQLRVSSTPGSGSEFCVLLPLAQPAKMTTVLDSPFEAG